MLNRFRLFFFLVFPGTTICVASLFFALMATTGHADEDYDRHRGHEEYGKDIREEIAALREQVNSLRSAVSALRVQAGEEQTVNNSLENDFKTVQTSNAKFQDQVGSLQTSNNKLQNQVTTLQNTLTEARNVLALGPFVSVDPNPEFGVVGPHIKFSGANVHIEAGTSSTSETNGLGNLIIGYDEAPVDMGGPALAPGDRSGSHNLIVGMFHRFTKTAWGGMVAGFGNTIQNEGTSVTGGSANTASGVLSSVTGGEGNTASGDLSSVVGGDSNTASGFGATITGGSANTAGGQEAVVIGGQNVSDNTALSIAPKTPYP
jgi:hypothetical protein